MILVLLQSSLLKRVSCSFLMSYSCISLKSNGTSHFILFLSATLINELFHYTTLDLFSDTHFFQSWQTGNCLTKMQITINSNNFIEPNKLFLFASSNWTGPWVYFPYPFFYTNCKSFVAISVILRAYSQLYLVP